ncbi:MAG: NitT/TauT family transport system permease protein [Actinomycetota bacterium]|jgi:NitT/TauT family transport system permease protein|nr:transporter permease subunit [Glaciihabitans sp.]MDQ1556264.1 NitT/TauT family transport system permease protein [Actinomycetota bacterium]
MTRRRGVRPVLFGIAGIMLLGVVWEVYKALGPVKGVVINGLTVLPRTDDQSMPHLLTMVTRLGEPVLAEPGSLPLWQVVATSAGFTLGLAAISWLIGVVVGMLLAVLMQRFRTAESALLPWVILSQTVPIIALAPLVSGVGSQVRFGDAVWQDWMSVVVIASYLAFFPVSIGALRGLEAPERAAVELMHTYAVGWWTTLLRLRLPAAVPYLIPALRLGAASAVIGTVVAEVSIGLEGGVGRMMIEFASGSSGDPGKPWAPIFGAILIGLIAAGIVALLGTALKKYRRGEIAA